jgi:hypothetical protein
LDRDPLDYLTDEAQQEDETLFIPVAEPGGDRWTRFLLGILAGLGGAALITVSPLLGASLITIGYSVAALSMRGGANRFASSLCLGFALTALIGAALIAAEFTVPLMAHRFIAYGGQHFLVFPAFALLPWALAMLKYVYAVVRSLTAAPSQKGSATGRSPATAKNAI